MSDHKAVDLAAVILEDAGFEVVTAENGKAAFEALDDDGEPFCALVTDIDLGVGPDGWAVATRARSLKASLPVIYVTGASGHLWKSNGVRDSMLISKPFHLAQILDAIRALLRKSGTSCG